ncbi:1-acyl-sn-glycerol-3-phosphate acyltransferase [Candidatus Saccharibacteria bacterium]|nr:1-acyl-sn-glycerol-3-phosphate acyltransferase [Candidatus Saccharibacteria bacterium]
MIIGGSKAKVIENIKRAIAENDLNRKVEEGDAKLDEEGERKIIEQFYGLRKSKTFRLKKTAMQKMADAQLLAYDRLISFDGLENLPRTGRFIITSNHFNPLDNLCIKKLIKKAYRDEPYIVIQATNLAAEGVIGDLFNYLNHIPVCKSANYIRGEFMKQMSQTLNAGHPVLIYPEEEMWFNYRKPRPNKRGAFYFAAELEAPIVPCFVEILDTKKPDNDEFFESKYILHILPAIYPDENKSVRQNSIEMCAKDYELKKAAYEKVYKKKLDYSFEKDDIANWRGEL